ncbi:hypothetical protein D9M73_172080 [compost metagenome]
MGEMWGLCGDLTDPIASKLAPTFDLRFAYILWSREIPCGSEPARDGRDSVLRQAQRDLYTTVDITDTHLPTMQLDHLFNEVKPQPCAFSPTVRTRQ